MASRSSKRAGVLLALAQAAVLVALFSSTPCVHALHHSARPSFSVSDSFRSLTDIRTAYHFQPDSNWMNGKYTNDGLHLHLVTDEW